MIARKRLIAEWRMCWRWFSVRAMAAAIALQGAWLAMPDDLRNAVPGWLGQAVTIALLVLGIFGRLVDQTPKEKRP